MPSARPPLMDTSENTATPSPAPASTARRSGRERRAPEKFQPEAGAASKRKRGEDDDDDVENHNPAADDEESDEMSEDDDSDGEDTPDEEEQRAARRQKNKKGASSQPSRSRKPAAKKPKINGAGPAGVAHSNSVGLPSRPKPKKTARVVTGDHRDGDGVYADIFGSGDNSDDVAGRWYQKYRADNEAAVTDLVNCVLLASGCDEQVTDIDIRDPDNIQNRLSELQDLYQEKQITDYPLARVKESRGFRDYLVGFFESLINVLHETGALYTDEPLMENIARWVYTMSSSTLRPFRHTATTVALAMELALAGVAQKLDDRIAKTSQQVDTERGRKGKNKNKDMLANLQKSLNEAERNREMCSKYMLDCFDVVFVHRYRDVDPRIRTECVDALGSWIWVLPTVFMEPEYLRYLGWLLSDFVASTRQEVLKQLSRMFKRDAAKLGHFIDRFRPRLMEMATLDLDVSVRVAAINVIEALGENGMLEPDEIDNVGRLIFDSEPRIRKAVVKFFADVVEAAVEQKIEAMGGDEVVDEIFPEGEDVEESFSPRKEWVEVKALAETLEAYESQLEDDDEEDRRDMSTDMISVMVPETRMSLASQVLYEKLRTVKDWGILIGYLLHDHSTSTKSNSRSRNSAEKTIRQHVAPTAEEEIILLEVLVAAVKQNLAHIADAEKGKKKLIRSNVTDSAEDIALSLVQSVPKLLNRFGAAPKAVTTVLRLSHLLDLDVFEQLHQDSSTFEHFLDSICTQFSRQEDKDAVSDAAFALLRARKCDEFEETVDLKISELWENSIDSLRNLDRVNDLSKRGELNAAVLSSLSSTLLKISSLAKIKNCVDILETEGRGSGAKTPVIDVLVKTVHRGRFQQPDEELDDMEDEATSFAIKSCQLYFMWKVVSITRDIETQVDIPANAISRLAGLRKLFQTNLIHTFSSRAINDDLRLFATGSLCDLHVTFASIKRTLNQWSAVGASKKYAGLLALNQEIQPGLVPELINIFDGAERAYAKKAKKHLNEPAEDEDPIDDDQLSDAEDEEDLSDSEKRAAELRAEKSLCELAHKYVLAILTRVVDQTGPHAGKLRKRLQRNATKLGKNFQDAVAYLDERKIREAEAAKARRAAASKARSKAPAANVNREPAKSAEIVVAGDESDEEEQPEEGTEEDLRRRELLEDPVEDPESDADEAGINAADDESILGD
ncbi:STAG-domain-containing protein [Cryphonectria parasitica EP155]|uniref:STAG-domain-containing protein n=1 Tax=Cryphonectria parasitica (strain ATCC 38755 / EP155) TaxID=660469 RepID=A0A9P4YDP9_CRYP1|nr:STAG-domain-containing protein [Cryphonectria parasitica EP155]KAF3770730.1 STAG-domain-containing protein [Cryphonectria parasitica EP155]